MKAAVWSEQAGSDHWAREYQCEIEYVIELPKTVSGKIRRVELWEREWATKVGSLPH